MRARPGTRRARTAIIASTTNTSTAPSRCVTWIAVSAWNGSASPSPVTPRRRHSSKPAAKSIGGHQTPWQVGKSRQASVA